MDHREINRRIRQLIRELLAMPENSIRPANQNAPTGNIDEQFATVLVTIIEPTGEDGREYIDQPGPAKQITERVLGQRLVSASVNFYRGDAVTKAMRVPALLSSGLAAEKMQALGLGFVRTKGPRNLTALVDTLWEERGQIDIDFHIIAIEDVTLNTYGTFPVAVDTAVKNPDGSFKPPQAFEVQEP